MGETAGKWLIEQELYEAPAGIYFTKQGGWSDDADLALTFDTEGEAQTIASTIIFDRLVIVTEHLFE